MKQKKTNISAALILCACVLCPPFVSAQTLSFGQQPEINEQPSQSAADKKIVFKKEQPKQATETPSYANRSSAQNNVQIKPVTNNRDYSDKVAIKIYIRNFKISHTLSSITNCSMDVYLESSLPSRISNLSFRLKWPELDTPFVFEDVEPKSTIYQGHSFIGKVCYSLDLTPNIIVNRCRVKNMSQQECANTVQWVK